MTSALDIITEAKEKRVETRVVINQLHYLLTECDNFNRRTTKLISDFLIDYSQRDKRE